MAQTTAIEWTDLSWNPTHGCSKVSPGCAHCYAETLSRRYKQTLKPWTPQNATLRTPDNPDGNVILKPHKLREPLSGAKDWQGLGAAAARAGKTDGKLVFVNSMSDLFHEQIPDEYILDVFGVMAAAERHTFQVLTKRPERMRQFATEVLPEHMEGLPNVWLGVSIENRRYVHRADVLRETPAAVRFISAEPLLGPLVDWEAEDSGEWDDGYEGPTLGLHGIDWLIVGGESGPGHRQIKPEWVRNLRDATRRYAGDELTQLPGPGHTAFLFKQWGGSTSKSGGRELDGRTWDEFPRVVA